MEHNVGMARKNFGRGHPRARPSPDRRGDRDGNWGGDNWDDKRNRSRNRWEHDDRGGSDYAPQSMESPVVGRRGRGRGRGGVGASPQPQKRGSRQNSPQYRRNSTEWGQYGKGQRPRRDSEGSNWGKGPYHPRGQESPQVYRRSSDPWGDGQKNPEHHRSDMNIRRNQAPGRNGPEGAEVDRSQRQKPIKVRRPDAQVYIPRARRQQMEERDDTDSPPPSNIDNPQGLGYMSGGPGRRNNQRPNRDVYAPRVKRAEQESNFNHGHNHYGSMPGLRYTHHQQPQQPPDYQEHWKDDNPGKYNQNRRKSLEGGNRSRPGSRSGSIDNRNRYNDGYAEYHEDRMDPQSRGGSRDRIHEQTFYNRAMRALTPEDHLDSRSDYQDYQGNYGGGRQNNNSDCQERTPSRNRRRRRSNSNSSRRSQPSPNRTAGGPQGRREGRRPSDTWSQDGTSMNRRPSESWSQDDGYYKSGSNSLPRRHRRVSGGNGGGYNNPDDSWSPGQYPTENWSPSHQMNDPWGPNESRTLGRIRRSSGHRSQDFVITSTENWSPTSQPGDVWNQKQPAQGRGRTRRKSGGHKSDNNDSNPARRMQPPGDNWNQSPHLDHQPQPNRKWQHSPGPTKRRNRNQARSVTPSESWSSDAENWESDSHSMGPSSSSHYTLPPCGNMVIEVTPGGRSVSDSNAAFSAMVGSPTHDPALLEETVRAQASDVSDKVRSLCADLSDLKHSKEKLNAELQGGTSKSRKSYNSLDRGYNSEKDLRKNDASPQHQTYDLEKKDYSRQAENSHVCSSTSSSTSPSHGPIVQRLDPPFVPHPIDADDISSDGQSSVQPESSTSVESPDMGEFHALSSAGEHEASPPSCSPGPPDCVLQQELIPEYPEVIPEGMKQGYVNDAFEDDPGPEDAQEDSAHSKLVLEKTKEFVQNKEQSENESYSSEPSAVQEASEIVEEQQSEKTDSDTLTFNVSTNDPVEPVDNCEKDASKNNVVDPPDLHQLTLSENEKDSEKSDAAQESNYAPIEPSLDAVDDSHSEFVEGQNEDVEQNQPDVADAGEIHLNWADMVDDDEDETEESTWDRLFDETGEALDPKLLDELTIAVGKEVKVQKPQADYYNYKPKDPDMDDREYGHLVEIFDFPKELLTRDLMVAFKDFHERGFDLKWVDDTHCIGVFSSAIAAQAALDMRHPLLKVRPISHASRQTKVKAKRCGEFLEPYRPRQETTAVVARSLVARALGIKSRVPKEKRDQERNKLKEAREKRNAAQRQKKDAWEGNFPKSHADH